MDRPTTRWLISLVLVASAASEAAAQYVARFQATAPGALTMTGNTLGLSSDGGHGPGTIGSIGAFITTDTTLVAPGGWPPGTTTSWSLNSASAQLRLPPDATVLHAELVWGGHLTGLPAAANVTIHLTPPGGDALLISPSSGLAFNDTSSNNFYARAVDVTAIVAAHGPGTWTVGGVAASLTSSQLHLRSAGWTLIVAYTRPDLPLRDLGIWVGLEPGGGAPAVVTGLCTPSAGSVRARVLVSAIEGDFQGYGDNMTFGPVGGPLTFLSGPNNKIGNFFAAQINDDLGLLDTTGSFGTYNLVPGSATTTGRHGWDITNVDASGILEAGATAASAQGVTSNEQYRVSTLGLQIDSGQPLFEPPGTFATAAPMDSVPGGEVQLGWRYHNAGSETASDATWSVALPPDLTLVPGSVRVNGVSAPNANPVAAPVALAPLAPGADIDLDLVATVTDDPSDDVLTPTSALAFAYTACGMAGANRALPEPVPVRVAWLEVNLTATPDAAIGVDDEATFTLTITNAGAGATRAAGGSITLPPGLAYVAGSTRVNGAALADPGGAFPFATVRLIGASPAAPGVFPPGGEVVIAFSARAAPTSSPRTLSVYALTWADTGVAESAVAARVDLIVTVCGDGVVGGREGCDDGPANSDTTPGACRSDCQPARCGDGVVDPGEACDTATQGELQCAYGEESCTVCDSACALVPGLASWCGDGRVDAEHGERCDDGANNSDTTPDACRSDCTPARCGDGVVDSDERCDDGDANGDAAVSQCSVTCDDRACGNGRVDEGEVCDPGADPPAPCAYGDASCRRCQNDCDGWQASAASWCGDGRVDLAHGETCDDGNDATERCRYGVQSCVVCGVGCQPTLGIASWCGDGFVDAAYGEECDHGELNGLSSGGAYRCSTSCRLESSGGSAGGCGASGDTTPPPWWLALLTALALAIAVRSRPAPLKAWRSSTPDARGVGSRSGRWRRRRAGRGDARPPGPR